MSRLPMTIPLAGRCAARLLASLALTLAVAAGSCGGTPMESRFPLSDPYAAVSDARLAGTWGRFEEGNLVEILRISRTDVQPFALMLQPLDGEPPLYMTAFATEVAGMTIYNVRRVAGIGQDYTLMARGGCAPYSPAHAPGYMLYFASIGRDGQSLALREFRPDMSRAPVYRRDLSVERHTNAGYADTPVIESEPGALLRYLELLEEPGQLTGDEDHIGDTRAYRRLDSFVGEVSIPLPFAERADRLLSVARWRHLSGDMAGVATMYDTIAGVVDCLGPEHLDDDGLRAYLTALVAAGRTGEAMTIVEAAAPEARDELLFTVGHARLRMGDMTEARALEDRIGDAELGDWLAYLRALSAHAAGNREEALAALEQLPSEPADEAVPPSMVADLYMSIGAKGTAERIRAEAAAEIMGWMRASWSPGERCTSALDDTHIAAEDEALAGAPHGAVLDLVRLDRPEALRRYLEFSVACPDTEGAADEEEVLVGEFWLRDPEIADALTRQADAIRKEGDIKSMRRDWMAAIAEAEAGRPAEALRLIEAAGVAAPEALRAGFDDGSALYFGAALGAAARALATAGNDEAAARLLESLFAEPAATLENAEARGWVAVLAAIAVIDPRPTIEGVLRVVQFADEVPDVATGLAAWELLSRSWGLPRLAAQRRAVIDNRLARHLLGAARDEIDARLAAAAESRERLADLGLPWLDVRVVIDFLTAPEQRAGALLAGAADEIESVDSPTIRVRYHLALAAMLAVMGDPAAAREVLGLAEIAAAEVPVTGAKGDSGGEFIELGARIH